MRLIDADKVKSKLQQHRDLFVDAWGGFEKMSLADKNRVDEIDNCIAEIVNAPTIKATPVVYGRWMLESKTENCNGGHTHYCDRCHDYYTTEADSLYFCPRCSAKMIGVEQPGRNGWKMELVNGELKRVWGVINERFMQNRTEADFPNYGAKMDGGVDDG